MAKYELLTPTDRILFFIRIIDVIIIIIIIIILFIFSSLWLLNGIL